MTAAIRATAGINDYSLLTYADGTYDIFCKTNKLEVGFWGSMSAGLINGSSPALRDNILKDFLQRWIARRETPSNPSKGSGKYADRQSSAQSGTELLEDDGDAVSPLDTSRVIADAQEPTFELDNDLSTEGCAGFDDIESTVAQLTTYLGEPRKFYEEVDGEGGKIEDADTTVEWRFSDGEGGVYTIYDWQTGGLEDMETSEFGLGCTPGANGPAFKEFVEKKLNGDSGSIQAALIHRGI